MTNEILEIMEKAFKKSAGKMGYTGDRELRVKMILNHVTAELKKREIEVDQQVFRGE